jgi:hypothetical protein
MRANRQEQDETSATVKANKQLVLRNSRNQEQLAANGQRILITQRSVVQIHPPLPLFNL